MHNLTSIFQRASQFSHQPPPPPCKPITAPTKSSQLSSIPKSSQMHRMI